MLRFRWCVAVLVCLYFAAPSPAQDAPLVIAQGTVEKVEKDTLTLRPRGPDGKFEKNVTLKLTGTTRVSTVAMQKRAGKLVPVQTDTAPKELQAKQTIAVIYTNGPDGPVLLAAVVHPAGGK